MASGFTWMGRYSLNLADRRTEGKESMVDKPRRDTMTYGRLLLVGIFVIGLVASAYGEWQLRPIHPDEPVEYTYEKRFSLDMALSSLQNIRASLMSFRVLTEEIKDKISKGRLKEIGNTDWETQHLGFKNMPGCIEGALRKQDYVIKELRYELAKERLKQKAIDEKELLDAQKAFEQAEKSFQTFWDNFGIAD